MNIYVEAWGKLPWMIIVPGIMVIFALVFFWPRIFKQRVKPAKPPTDVIDTTVTQNSDGSMTAEAKPKEGKYPAYVWRDGKGITYEKLVEPMGRQYIAEATLPHPGPCYLVIEKNGKLEAYDPRLVPLPEKGNSPRDLYRFLHWPEVSAVYVNISGVWEKINMLLPWVGVIVGGIVLMVLADKLAR